MTTGTKVRDRFNEDGSYFIRSWSGADDALHKRAENPYTASILDFQNTKLSQYSVEVATGVKTLMWANYNSYVGNDTKPTWDNNSELKLLSKLTDALRQHDFNAGIFGAEFGEALNSVVNTSLSVLMAYKQARKGDFSGALKTIARATAGTGVTQGRSKIKPSRVQASWAKPKYEKTPGVFVANSNKMHHSEIAQAHLAMTYAWMPLLQDIHSMMEWIESKTLSPREVQLVIRHSQPERLVEDHIGGSNYTIYMKHNVKGELRVHMVEEIGAARSLGLLNPTAVLWEVVPFSFVVDWFIPIGTYLDNIGFLKGLGITYGRTMKYRAEVNRRFTKCSEASWAPTSPQWPHSTYCHPKWINGSYAGPVGSYHLHEHSGCRRKKVWIDRTIGTSLNVPTPRPKDLEKALSLPHIQNAAALIWTGIAAARR